MDVPARVGDKLSPATYASTTIVHLNDPTTLEMEGLVDEVDIARVKVGQEATVELDALPGTVQRGKVTYISPVPTVKAGVVSYKTTVTLEKGDAALKEGMTATGNITVERRENVVLVPERALRDARTSPWVEVAKDGKLERRPVTPGKTDGKNREIIEGLKVGEKVRV